MKAIATPLDHAIRVYADDDAQYGDPYDWCALLTWKSPTEASIALVDKPVTRDIWRAVATECVRLGVVRLHMTRYHRDRIVERSIDVSKFAEK